MASSEAGLVRRTIVILRTVAAHVEGVGLSEVARESGIPKATCYRVLGVLEQEGWLTVESQTRRYRVSLGLLSIVGGLLDRDGAYGHLRDVLRRLAEETSESCGFDVLLPPEVMVVAQVPGPQVIGQTLKPVPRTQPVWATSTGKVFLASADEHWVRANFEAEFQARADANGGTLDEFLDSLVEVRELGYAVTCDELEVGASSIAAPIRVGEAVPYALWTGGPTYRFGKDRIVELAGLVCGAAVVLGGLLAASEVSLSAGALDHAAALAITRHSWPEYPAGTR